MNKRTIVGSPVTLPRIKIVLLIKSSSINIPANERVQPCIKVTHPFMLVWLKYEKCHSKKNVKHSNSQPLLWKSTTIVITLSSVIFEAYTQNLVQFDIKERKPKVICKVLCPLFPPCTIPGRCS